MKWRPCVASLPPGVRFLLIGGRAMQFHGHARRGEAYVIEFSLDPNLIMGIVYDQPVTEP